MADIFADTQVSPIVLQHSPDGDVRGLEGTASITSQWDLIGPNGGYLASLIWRAIIGLLDAGLNPLSFSCQYLAPATPGPAAVTVQVVSRTKRTLVCRAELMADGTPLVSALARFARSRDGLDIFDPGSIQPSAPAPDRLRPVLEWVPAAAARPFMTNIDLRLVSDEADLPGRHSVRPYFLAWARFEPHPVHSDGLVDIVRPLVLADALVWPAAERFYRGRPSHAARSTDIALSFVDSDAMTPWLLCESTTISARSGVVTGSVRLWSQDGRLVAVGLSNLYCGVRLEGK